MTKRAESAIDTKGVVKILNQLLELELAGVVRFNHYALMVFGHARIPIVSWLRQEATESMGHAQKIGEWITAKLPTETKSAPQAVAPAPGALKG